MMLNFLKYEIRKFCVAFSKLLQKDIHNLENKIKVLERKTHNGKNMKFYNSHKQEFSEVFNNIGEGIRILSRCQ